MDKTRQKITKYLIEIKKVKSKYSFFPDLFATVQKKKCKKLSEKLTDLQNIISNVDYDESNYKNLVNKELKKFKKKEIPEKIFEVIEKINKDLNNSGACLENNDSENKLGVIKKNILKNKEKNKSFAKNSLNILKCLKNITKIVKSLKRHTSWFFQKDNSAKIIYKLSLEIIKSIEKNITDENNEKNKKIRINNINSDLLSVKDYIFDALKLRIIEKSLHDNDSDDVKSILINLYDNFNYLNKLIFDEEFEELSQSFNSLILTELETGNLNYAKKYYIKLINNDLKKLYKKTSSIFKKDNEAKKLYRELSKLFKNLKIDLKKIDNYKNIKENLIQGGKSICKYADERKTRLINENRATDKDLTLKIMYNLYDDYNNFIYIFGESLPVSPDKNEYLEVDEITKKKYYKINFSKELLELFNIKKLLAGFNKYKKIKDLIENIENGPVREKLKEIFSKVIKSLSEFREISFIDSSGNISVQEFNAWEKEFESKISLYSDYIISHVNFADFCKSKDKDKKKKFADEKIKELNAKMQKIEDKLISARNIIHDPKNEEKFKKDHENKESKFKKINGKRFIKANSVKISGTVIASVPIVDLGKIIVTVESLKVAKFFSVSNNISNTHSVFLPAEISLDCKLFKIMSLGAVKIRVYLAIDSLSIIKSIHEICEPNSVIWSLINFDEIKKLETNLNINNNLSSGSVYFFPYKSNIEQSENNFDNNKNNKNNNIDIGKSIVILKEIKSEIKYFAPSGIGKIFKSNITELIYKPLYKIYKSLSRTIKSASSDELEIKDVIARALLFINQKIKDINYKSKNNKNINKIIDKLQKLYSNFKSLGQYLLADKNLFNNYSNHDSIDSKEIIESTGNINIYGEVLASVPFLQDERKVLKDCSDEKLKKQGISSYTQVTQKIAKKNNPGYVLVTIENANLKDAMPEHDYKFDESKIKNSMIACVADLTINVNLDKLIQWQGKCKSLANYVINSTLHGFQEKGGLFNKSMGSIANKLIKWGWPITKLTPKDYEKYVDLNLKNAVKIIKKGLRTRIYLSISQKIKKMADMIKISQNIQKGKIKVFK